MTLTNEIGYQSSIGKPSRRPMLQKIPSIGREVAPENRRQVIIVPRVDRGISKYEDSRDGRIELLRSLIRVLSFKTNGEHQN